jgi:hypothetical protein
MLFLQILCVQDKKKMFAIHKIIIHKIIHRNVCYIAFFYWKKEEERSNDPRDQVDPVDLVTQELGSEKRTDMKWKRNAVSQAAAKSVYANPQPSPHHS